MEMYKLHLLLSCMYSTGVGGREMIWVYVADKWERRYLNDIFDQGVLVYMFIIN